MNRETVTPQQARRTGYQAGLAAWRPAGPHAVPPRPYPGWSEQGREWFLGMIEGLEKAEAEHRHHPETFDGAGYIRHNFFRGGNSDPGARVSVAVMGSAQSTARVARS